MTKYCTRCGCELQKTNYGAYWCPNDGKLPENQDDYEKETSGDADYIG